jgi:hypothetical protein
MCEHTKKPVFEAKKHGVHPQNGIPGKKPAGQNFFSTFPKEFSHFLQT